jgi:putative transposase
VFAHVRVVRLRWQPRGQHPLGCRAVRKYRILNVLDELTHECLAIRIAHKLKASDVIDVLSDLFILRGVPAHIWSGSGPEFMAKAVQAAYPIGSADARPKRETSGGPRLDSAESI